MYLLGREHLAISCCQRTCSGRVGDNGHFIAKVKGTVSSRIDTHMRHKTCQDYMPYPSRLQLLMQVSLNKGIREILDDHRLTFDRRHFVRDSADMSSYIVRRSRSCIMLNMEHRHLQLSRHVQQLLHLKQCTLDTGQLHDAATIGILTVDQNERRVLKWRRTHAKSQ